MIGLLSGLLFGLGLVVSGMVLPQKVQGFLDISGQWDPSLMLVMGGALAVFLPGYFWLIRPRRRALNGSPFHLPTKTRLDRHLLLGSALFGIGWGLGGICPGPAMASLPVGSAALWVFVLAMLAGIKLVCWWEAKRHSLSSKAAADENVTCEPSVSH